MRKYFFFLPVILVLAGFVVFAKSVFADWTTDLIPPITSIDIASLPAGCVANGLTVSCTVFPDDPALIRFVCTDTGGSNCQAIIFDGIPYPVSSASFPLYPPYSWPISVNAGTHTIRSIDNAGNLEGIKDMIATPSNIKIIALRDASYNGCESGAVPYTLSPPTLRVIRTYLGVSLTCNPDLTDGECEFPTQIPDNTNYYDVYIDPSTLTTGYRLVSTEISPPGGTTVGNGIHFLLQQETTITFCFTDLWSWYQVDQGDVRMKSISTSVPSGHYVSDVAANPPIFFSSEGSINPLNAPVHLTTKWIVDAEYSYNKIFEMGKGSTSYSFYESKAHKLGIPITNINTISGCNTITSCDLSSGLPTGVYLADGDFTLNRYSHTAGSHVVILVHGNATVKNNNANCDPTSAAPTVNCVGVGIPTGANNLFVLAASGSLDIDPSVGTTLHSDIANTQLDGIYTAEGHIVIAGAGFDSCNTSSGDRRLNIGGVLIANADYPFRGNTPNLADSIQGEVHDMRSLCVDNHIQPTMRIFPRYDFITQLTDFYKESDSRWEEIEP